jgi:hypothetical protein
LKSARALQKTVDAKIAALYSVKLEKGGNNAMAKKKVAKKAAKKTTKKAKK